MTHCPDHFEIVRDCEALRGKDELTRDKLDTLATGQEEIKQLIIKQNSRVKSLERWRLVILGGCTGVLATNTPGLMKALAIILKGF